MRNKRIFDLSVALVLLLLFPLASIKVKKPGAFFVNCLRVLAGRLTWVGYSEGLKMSLLPKIRQGVLPPYNILPRYEPAAEVKTQINIEYAQHYSSLSDLNIILANNIKYLGGK